MKITYTGIKSIDQQSASEVRQLAERLGRTIAATNDPRHPDQQMRVQVKEVEKDRTLESVKHIKGKGKVLEVKLFFTYGPFFLWNKPAEAFLEREGFKAFTQGYVKYFGSYPDAYFKS